MQVSMVDACKKSYTIYEAYVRRVDQGILQEKKGMIWTPVDQEEYMITMSKTSYEHEGRPVQRWHAPATPGNHSTIYIYIHIYIYIYIYIYMYID